MAETQPTGMESFQEFVEEMNRTTVESMERSVEAQSRFLESWFDLADGYAVDGDRMDEFYEGYLGAYETWMEAAEEVSARAADAAEGEEVDAEEFRDVWLNAANEAFKEVMSTTAFAAATGQLLDQMLEARAEADENVQEAVRGLGFAATGDVDEVGERLVELERRQHSVEEKLDRVLDALE